MKKVLILLCMFFASFAQSAVLAVGDSLPEITLNDQFDKPLSVNAHTKVLLFSRDMQGGKVIQAALEQLSSDTSKPSVVYFADINGMPSLIAKFVAIPKMQDFAFAVGLDREGDKTSGLPSGEDKATMIKLSEFKITKVEQFEDAELLLKALTKE